MKHSHLLFIAATANSTEFVAKEHLQSMRVRSLKDMPNPERGLTKLKSEDHRNKKKVVVMESNQIIYKKVGWVYLQE